MAGKAWTQDDIARLVRLAEEGKNRLEIGALLDRTPHAVRMKAEDLDLSLAKLTYGEATRAPEEPPTFEVGDLPDELPTADELLIQRAKAFTRKAAAKQARHLIPVRVNIHGPVGIAHMGDTHVDDDGTDIEKVQRHVDVLKRTEGMLVGNVGDYQNNWVGRIAHLYGQQSLSAKEAWVLVEWLIKSMQWLYLIGGNHDAWSGAGDPLKWISSHSGQLYEPNGARLGLEFPNGRQIRVNARHNWPGHSQWNAAHGVSKAAQMGWRDHVLTCGHTHVSGYQVVKDPASGLISHALQVASYKTYDRYAEEKALRDQTIFMCPVTVIRPEFADDDPRLITTFFDPESAADYLKYLRGRKAAA